MSCWLASTTASSRRASTAPCSAVAELSVVAAAEAGAFIGAGALVEGYFVSTAAFDEVWRHYAQKLEIKLPYQRGFYGENPTNGPEIIINNLNQPHSGVP